jgi:hypothetical protein
MPFILLLHRTPIIRTKVAEAGKICCIETINPSYEDTAMPYMSFRDKDLPPFVAYYRRTLPFVQIKDWLDTNSIMKSDISLGT